MVEKQFIKPTPGEIWASKPDIPKVVVDLLRATAEEYDLELWINGEKIHSATLGETDPKDQA